MPSEATAAKANVDANVEDRFVFAVKVSVLFAPKEVPRLSAHGVAF